MSEPSISIGTVQGGQNNIGHTEINGNQIQNLSGQETASLEKFFEALRSAIPPATATEEAAQARAAVDELEQRAKTGAPLPESDVAPADEADVPQGPQSAFDRIIGPYIKAIAPYGPAAANAVFAFGDEFFSSVAQKNSWISASLKALKAFQAATK